jgi:hypothetical protein
MECFRFWHIASFRRDVEFVRDRGKTDIDQAAPIELDLWVRALSAPRVSKNANEDATVIYPPNAARLVRQHRFDGGPFMIAEFVAHDSRLRFRSLNSLNHVSCSAINPQWPMAMLLMA